MPNLLDRLAASVGFTRSPKGQQSYGRGPLAKIRVQQAIQGWDPRRGAARCCATSSRQNEWVRLAIDYRREQIVKAPWKIVRIDDPKASPSPAVEKAVRDLFSIVNPKRDSIETLLGKVLEDVLVLDAGVIEKEHTLGGGIAYLWDLDGSTIIPDPSWNGSDLNAPRYFQIMDGREVAHFTNDEMLYIMRSETTYSPIGWSPVETLMRAIEADLYGEQYDFSMLKQTAPAGMLGIPGMTAQETQALREFYTEEVAGTQDILIFGYGGMNGETKQEAKWQPFGRTNREQERQLYKEWLVKKIAAVFQVDKGIFNITEAVNRATSKTQQQRTDEGLESLANTLQRYITREIIWEFDKNHGFQFEGITDRDALQQAELDTTYIGAGAWTINEVRAKQGLDPVEWGDDPFLPTVGPVSGEVPPSPSEQMAHEDAQAQAGRDHDQALAQQNPKGNGKPAEGGKSIAPFVLAAQRSAVQMRRERLSYLNTFEE